MQRIIIMLAFNVVKCNSFKFGFRFQRAFQSSRLLAGEDNNDDSNHRFWTRTLNISSISEINTEILSSELQKDGTDLSSINFGMAIFPTHNLIIPIHNGMLQTQHATKTSSNNDSSNSIICGFAPRASHVCTSPDENERPIDLNRLKALNDALISLGTITPEELLNAEYAGTPPSRIYRSFVSPRAKAVHILETIERAATRTAMQIDLAVRQVRADKAAYLRNTDKSSGTLSSFPQPTRTTHPVVLVLDNIRSAFNVGSMFRTAETAGVEELITCGITAHPPHPKLRKTAFSSIDEVPSRHFEDTLTAVTELRARGYKIIAMETTARSEVYTKVSYPEKVALVLGNEVTGVDTRIMDSADLIVEIPTFGVKNSLNVASA